MDEDESYKIILIICIILACVILFATANTDIFDQSGCETYEVDQRGNVCLSD